MMISDNPGINEGLGCKHKCNKKKNEDDSAEYQGEGIQLDQLKFNRSSQMMTDPEMEGYSQRKTSSRYR